MTTVSMGTRLRTDQTKSWIIMMTRREMIWTRVRGVLGAVVSLPSEK